MKLLHHLTETVRAKQQVVLKEDADDVAGSHSNAGVESIRRSTRAGPYVHNWQEMSPPIDHLGDRPILRIVSHDHLDVLPRLQENRMQCALQIFRPLAMHLIARDDDRHTA